MEDVQDTHVSDGMDIVRQEVARRVALGSPAFLDRDELISAGSLAMVEAIQCGTSGKRLRFAIRSALSNLLRRELTRCSRAGEMPEESADLRGGSGEFSLDDIAELVYDLSPKQMTAIRLVYFEEMTQAQAAEEMGCSQQDVSSLISAAKKNLRDELVKRNV